MARFALVLSTTVLLASIVQVLAQPSPDVQKRISAAIAAAANASTIDYTEFVNPFIGTGRPFLSLHASFSALTCAGLSDANGTVPRYIDFNFYGDVW